MNISRYNAFDVNLVNLNEKMSLLCLHVSQKCRTQCRTTSIHRTRLRKIEAMYRSKFGVCSRIIWCPNEYLKVCNWLFFITHVNDTPFAYTHIVVPKLTFIGCQVWICHLRLCFAHWMKSINLIFFYFSLLWISVLKMASADLSWLIIRNNNSYLLKKRDIKKPFSTVRTKLWMDGNNYSRIEHDDFSTTIKISDGSWLQHLFATLKFQLRFRHLKNPIFRFLTN